MKEKRSWLTPRQAAELSGMTTRTINNYITSGKLSATREDNRYFIEKSEFFRVFPNCMVQKNAHKTEKSSENEVGKTLEIEVQYLKEALLDKEKQNDFLKMLVECYNHEKNMMLQTINTHSKMLENKQEQKNASEKKQRGFKESILKLFRKE